MKRTIKMQVEIPATKVSLFEARKSAQAIIAGLEFADRKGAKYDVKAIHAFTQNLRGAAGVYDFDVIIDNQYIPVEKEAEVIEQLTASLPSTHKIVSIN